MRVDHNPDSPHYPGMDRRRFLLTSLAGLSPRYRRFLKRGSKPARKLE
jgi:hypothetical protein